MKKVLLLVVAIFTLCNFAANAQKGNECNFERNGKNVKGRIYEVERTTYNENKSDKTNSWGVQGSVGLKKIFNAGGNYNNSTSSNSTTNSSTTRRGYECCDDNSCTSNYNEDKSKKGKYLKP